ncbi:MAG TPA: hypothetical protein VG456_16250 [Candidatus Sulfopaludibacter sp.]|jgi:hypothetical protein|nr:hypothetical protein [Candidatus Sulfopaludibacter sp.]
MSRSGLKFLAILLGVLMIAVLFAGLDGLPRSVRAQIDTERTALASAQKQLQSAKDEVTREVQADPALFQSVMASRQWPVQLGQDETALQSASRNLDELTRLQKANRRGDQKQVESLLSQERGLREQAVTGATSVQKDAAHWVDMKKRLPDTLQAMDRDYQAIHSFDFTPVSGAVQKAEGDWPQKKADLDSRLTGMKSAIAQDDELWNSTAASRKAAAAGDLAHVEFGPLISAADSLHNSAAELPAKATEVKALTGQLYNSWDKVLIDMETRGIGTDRSYDQKIRTVNTHLADASAKTGEVTSDEKWVVVPQSTYKAEEKDLGMAVEHKSAGQYDVEADRVAQPAGFAYVAPPGQSNQYGYWDHSSGRDFWVFYGQYALMRDLLWNHSYRPLERYDYDGYYSSRRMGQTYYGRDEASGGSRYGTAGSATQERYSGSTFAKGGGFKSSQFASKSGGYRDSKFSSPMAKDPNADHGARTFGNHSGEPRVTPPSRSFSPRPSTPRPSFRPPSSGRSFGRRR